MFWFQYRCRHRCKGEVWASNEVESENEADQGDGDGTYSGDNQYSSESSIEMRFGLCEVSNILCG